MTDLQLDETERVPSRFLGKGFVSEFLLDLYRNYKDSCRNHRLALSGFITGFLKHFPEGFPESFT